MTAVEIEIDGKENECLHFRPLQRSIRGRFDFARLREPMAGTLRSTWPEAIPSMRLGIAGSDGYLLEPLYDDEHKQTREKIEGQGMKLADAKETFADIDLPTWLFWIKRAVESGIAKVVSGKLPDRIEGEPQLSFITKREPSDTARLATAIERTNELLGELVKAAKGKSQ
ncbi:MAG: hypothetical protein IIA67_08800 [Planctomycetes bacterium]|nr:hypothetical protein [Planctomycetota bacterium]